MIDWTKPVRRIGIHQLGRVLCTDGPGEYPVAVWWEYHDGPCSYTLDGRANIDWHAEVENIPQPTVLWLIVHSAENGAYEVRDFRTNFVGDRPVQYRLEISEDGKTITGERVE